MRKAEVLKVYKTCTAVADLLEISIAAVSQWGPIIPVMAAHEIAKDGKIPFDARLYRHSSTRSQRIAAALSA